MAFDEMTLRQQIGSILEHTDEDGDADPLTSELSDQFILACTSLIEVNPEIVSQLRELNSGVLGTRAMMSSFKSGTRISSSPWSALSKRLEELTGPAPDES